MASPLQMAAPQRRDARKLSPQDERLLMEHCQQLAQLLNDPNADPSMKQAAMDNPMSRMCLEMFPQMFMIQARAQGGSVSPLRKYKECSCQH